MPVAILIPALQLLQPMPGVITQGVRPGHPAIDIACIPGTPVRAAHDGQGSQERSLTHGITFVLNGSGGLRTSYSHLERRLVLPGARVRKHLLWRYSLVWRKDGS